MIEIFLKIINTFYNKSMSFGKRISYLIIFTSILFFVEYHFEFSYNFYLNNKLEQLNNINNLKEIYSSDSTKIKELKIIEQRIINRSHYSEYLLKIPINDFNIFKNSDNSKKHISVNNNDTKIINKPIRSYFWMMLSSSYFLCFIVLSVLLLPITHKQHRSGSGLVGLIAGSILISLIIMLITWTSYFIPLLGKPIFNYILNFIIHTTILIIIVRILEKRNKKN